MKEQVFVPIKITEMIANEIGTPRNDGTQGSALYSVPFRLSSYPPAEWADFFIQTWNLPPEFTTMHRPGIASVEGNSVVLHGTTVEEVEKYHKKTLVLAAEEANRLYQEHAAKRAQHEQAERERLSEHKKNITEMAKRIKFDE